MMGVKCPLLLIEEFKESSKSTRRENGRISFDCWKKVNKRYRAQFTNLKAQLIKKKLQNDLGCFCLISYNDEAFNFESICFFVLFYKSDL